MKTVIGYGRISTKDQSNFSLPGQEKMMREYCERNCYTLTKLFLDDGQSAKNFDRAEWKDLEKFIRDNHTTVDVLLVPKFDRFSRNLSDALQMIEMIEKKFGIEIISVNEPIPVKRDSPMFFQLRTQYLMGAQVEWMIIRERTKEGIYNATKAGRWINMAPFGYTNARDAANKPILKIHKHESKIVAEIFELFLTGTPQHEIYKALKEKLPPGYSKANISKILRSPVYAGIIKVKAHDDKPAEEIKGIHTPIITKAQWYRAFELLNPNTYGKKIKFTDEFELRGALHCECGALFTAAKSKGKSAYFPYYFHISNHRKNFNADKIHEQFHQVLSHLSFPLSHLNYLHNYLEEQIAIRDKERTQSIYTRKKLLREAERNIESVNQKFILDQIDHSTYKELLQQYRTAKTQNELLLHELQQPIEKVYSKLMSNMHLMNQVLPAYKKMDVQQKHSFINLVFEDQLSYSANMFRTPYIMNIFRPKAALLKELGLLELTTHPHENSGGNTNVPLSLRLSNTSDLDKLNQFIQLLAA